MAQCLSSPPAGGAFTPLHLTTSGRFATLDAPPSTPAALIEAIRAAGLGAGPVRAVNCNMGCVCQPGHEDLLKDTLRPQPIAAAGHKQRQFEGNGRSFGSAVAPIIRPLPGSAMERALLALDPVKHAGRQYCVLYFPTTGSMGVSGSVMPACEDGDWAIDQWVEFLNRTNALGAPVRITARGFRMVNGNCVLRKWVARQVFNFAALREFLLGESAAYMPPGMAVRPAQLQLDASQADGSFTVGIAGFPRRNNTVKMYLKSGKVTLMGLPSIDALRALHAFLDRVFSEHWGRLVALKPRPDAMPPADRRAEADAVARAGAECFAARAGALAAGARDQKGAAAALGAALAALAAAEEERAAEAERAGLLDLLGDFADYV